MNEDYESNRKLSTDYADFTDKKKGDEVSSLIFPDDLRCVDGRFGQNDGD